jgi:RNA polymerase sigma-70 factor (ECF subfamily)
VVGQLDFVAAMESLSPELHNTFEAVAIDGLSMHEASALLGVPEGTIKSRMHRARLTLREELR